MSIKETISTRLETFYIKKLEAIAEKDEHSVSFLLRKAAIAFIEKKEKEQK